MPLFWRDERPAFVIDDIRADENVPGFDSVTETFEDFPCLIKKFLQCQPGVLFFEKHKEEEHPGGCDSVPVYVHPMD